MVTQVVMRWSYGDAFYYDLSTLNLDKIYGGAYSNAYASIMTYRIALHYGLSMFIELDNVW